MASTTFIDQATLIVASWLNDINTACYNALGNGTSVPTTNAQALSNLGGAPLISPSLSGTPLAPTPAKFDATTKIATMAALQSALGNTQGVGSFNSSFTATSSQTGTCFYYTGTSSSTVTLPAPSTCGNGASFWFETASTGGLIINTPSGVFTGVIQNGSGTTSTTLAAGLSLFLVTDGTNWIAYAGTGLLSTATTSILGLVKLATTSNINSATPNVVPDAAAVNGASAGYGSWHDNTASRALSTNYTNTTGRPMFYQVITTGSTNPDFVNMIVGGVTLAGPTGPASQAYVGFSVVPPGVVYSATAGGTSTLHKWFELY